MTHIVDVLEKRQAAEAEQVRVAKDKYRDLLHRHTALTPEDEKQLKAIMERINISDADVIADVQALERASVIEPIANDVDARLAVVAKARAALGTLAEDERKALLEYDRKRNELTSAIGQANKNHSEAFNAVGELGGLKLKHPHLF